MGLTRGDSYRPGSEGSGAASAHRECRLVVRGGLDVPFSVHVQAGQEVVVGAVPRNHCNVPVFVAAIFVFGLPRLTLRNSERRESVAAILLDCQQGPMPTSVPPEPEGLWVMQVWPQEFVGLGRFTLDEDGGQVRWSSRDEAFPPVVGYHCEITNYSDNLTTPRESRTFGF